MHLSLRALRYIVSTAEAGSVTTAARELNVSQPSISSAIKGLEAELGVTLFVRHHARGVTTTPAGRDFVRQARVLLQHAREFEVGVSNLGSGLTGEVTVGCFVTLATRYMPGLLAEFSRRAPGVRILLEEGNQAEIVEGLLGGRIEIAISYAYNLPEDIGGEVLADLPPHILLPEFHRLASAEAVSLAEVCDEPFILLDLPHSRDYFLGLFGMRGLVPRIVFRSKSYELIRGLVGRGHGYAIHNALPGNPQTYDGGRVVVRRIAEHLPPATVMSLKLERQAMRPSVRAFSDFLHEAFGAGGMFDATRDRA